MHKTKLSAHFILNFSTKMFQCLFQFVCSRDKKIKKVVQKFSPHNLLRHVELTLDQVRLAPRKG